VDRFNKTLISMVKAYLKGQQTDWDLYLGCLAGAYRSSTHSSTGFTPNMLMLGKEVRIPTEIIFGNRNAETEPITSYGDYVEILRERMCTAHRVAQRQLGIVAKRQKESCDKREKSLNYEHDEVGDLVWYLNEVKREGISPKLQSAYWGPCVITQKLSDFIFRIRYKEDGSSKVVHHNKLKKFYGGTGSIPDWCRQKNARS
jgi:hypothetical protein